MAEDRKRPGRPEAEKSETVVDRLEIIPSRQGARLRLRVKPAARIAGIDGEHAGALKVSVCALPEKGRANAEVERLLATRLDLPRSSVQVVAGHSSRSKVV